MIGTNKNVIVTKLIFLFAYTGARTLKSDPQEHNGDEEEEEEEEDEEEEDMVPPCGPIRIRNLEDLLRQLEHPPPLHHTSGSDLRLSEPEADRHYRVDRTDSASGTESQLEPGLQFYLGQHHFNNHEEAEEEQRRRDFKEEERREEEEEFDSDEEEEEGEGGGYETGGGFVRCASEEALNYTIANHTYDKNYDKNLDHKLMVEKGGVVNKREGCEYVPSPPSDNEGGGGGKGYFPPPSGVIPSSRVAAPPSSSSSTSGSQPPSGAKRKGKKKFPEYKV